tara:strand:- start:831 stop:1358 length:528 start_codon:yes stop_codon:yes gene_type:complete
MSNRFFNVHHGGRAMTPGTLMHMQSPEAKETSSPHNPLPKMMPTFDRMKGAGITGKKLSRQIERTNNGTKDGQQHAIVDVRIPLLTSMNADGQGQWSNNMMYPPAPMNGTEDEFGGWDNNNGKDPVADYSDYSGYNQRRNTSKVMKRRPKSAGMKRRRKKKKTRPKSANPHGRSR